MAQRAKARGTLIAYVNAAAPATGAIMSKSFYNDPDQLRACAEELRSVAEEMTETATKEVMLQIADSYDELAERAEQGPRAARCAISRQHQFPTQAGWLSPIQGAISFMFPARK